MTPPAPAVAAPSMRGPKSLFWREEEHKMLKTSEIFKAIRQTLAQHWPDRMVYTDTVPEDFERPAFFVQYIGTKPPEEKNMGTIAMTHNFEIVIYGEKNEDWITMQEELMDLQQEVLLLFAFGKMQVEDRWPDVKASASAGKDDEAYVSLQIEYWDDRPMVEKNWPLMEEVSTKMKVNEREDRDGTAKY